MLIRPFREADLPGLVDVCIRTGAAGADATGTFEDDRLLADVYAVPYAVVEPERCLVLDDRGGVAGYVLGTADTAAFVAWYRSTWLPATASRYRAPADPPAGATDELLQRHRHPERMLRAELAAFPAHLHIDLLPAAQGSGHGTALLAAFLEGLRRDGVAGVHLGAAAGNVRARAFYEARGFVRAVVEDPGAVWYVRPTG